MRDFIRYLAKKEGISVLVSSHLLSEIQLLCDRVAIMTNGEIIATDDVDKLLSDREKTRWRFEPMAKGAAILAEMTDVTEQDGAYYTSFEADKLPVWNSRVVRAGVQVLEMQKITPSLEDLFIELTGGQGID